MRQLPTRKLAAALAGSALLLTTACGGGGGGRPSTDDIQKAISNGSNSVFGSAMASVPKDALGCIAKALHDSKLSDSALRAIVDGKKDYDPSSSDKTAVTGLTSDIMKCASGALQ